MRLANVGAVVLPVNPNVVKPLMLVDPEYMRAAIDTVKAQYGSFEKFTEEVYGITPEMRERFKDAYTYSPTAAAEPFEK